ncbi:MAG: GH25 family lysozyme [Blastomonas sp.]
MASSRVRNRLVWLAVSLAILAALGWLLWQAVLGWAPSRDQYPLQGPTISEIDGPIAWPTVKTMGADFAYIRASHGADSRDSRFAENFANARDAGMRVGAMHEYVLCRLASDQASVFVTTVPRTADALPPAISLSLDESCTDRPNRSLVLGELNTLINQIESHAGKPALLQVSPEFEAEYRISEGIARTVWLTGDFFPPDYAAKPWVMWQASSRHAIRGAQEPVRWNVVRP